MIKHPEVLVYGHPGLRQKAEEITDVSLLRKLSVRMHELMRDHNGVGLAATQIGQPWRVIVWRVDEQDGTLANPVLELGEERETATEGCLSVPGMAGDVERALRVRATGLDIDCKQVTIEGEGLLARVLQHETDHLDGVLFVDRVTPGTLRPTGMTEVPGI